MHLSIIYASTSGHTRYVVERLVASLQKIDGALTCRVQRSEQATLDDLTGGEVLVLASGTWNTGGVEGQLNPHMYDFVHAAAKGADLRGRTAAIIALGDDRYFYTSRAGEHLRQFVITHNGTVWPQVLTIVNDPYGQEKKIETWAKKLSDLVRSGSPKSR